MRKLVQSFVLRRYQRNHFVYNQGEISQHVYIVQGGDFEVVRKKRNQKQIAQDAKKLIGPGYNEKLQQSLIKTDKPGNRQMNLDKHNEGKERTDTGQSMAPRRMPQANSKQGKPAPEKK